MSAKDFPITFGYGAIDNIYYGPNGSVGAYHRGEDRAMPDGTPVIVNGVEIGLSGQSGTASGPHLHVGRFMGGQDTDPNGGGFEFANAVVTQVNSDATNGNYVRIQADGASWVYLHLSSQTVRQGQILVETAPVVPAPAPVATYQEVETYPDGKLIELNKQPTNLWGMNYHFDYMKDHPVEVHNQGEVWTVTNKVHHEDGYDYYRRDGQIDGFNVLDCDDYMPPSPPPPVPYAPPAAPVPVTKAEVYDLVTSVPYFATASDAFHNKQSLGSLSATSYFVFSKDIGMLNLTTNNQKDLQHWINPALNVAEPPKQIIPVQTVVDLAKEPVTPTVSDPKAWYDRIYWLNSSMLPEYFLPTHKVEFADLSGTRPESYFLPEAQPVKVYGTITNPGTNTKYYLLKLPSDTEFQYRFAVAMVDPHTGKAQMLKQAIKVVRNRDHVRVIMSEAEELGLKFIDAIIPKWYRKNNNKKDS